MNGICVITGGGSGMGLETARIMGKENKILLSGRNIDKLDRAVKELEAEGVSAKAVSCDVSDIESVKNFAAYAASMGKISSVIHAAGISPGMGDPEKIMRINALGTININNIFFKIMEEGSCIINVSSMSAYMMPEFLFPKRLYSNWSKGEEVFMKKMMARVNLFPKKARTGIAYCISKNFVVWLSKITAEKFGEKGVRIISVSPGAFETPMGEVEKEESETLLKHCAIKRVGHVTEIAHLFAMCADKRLGYLTGTDIIMDGGCIAGYNR